MTDIQKRQIIIEWSEDKSLQCFLKDDKNKDSLAISYYHILCAYRDYQHAKKSLDIFISKLEDECE